LFDDNNRAVLTDFGIARLAENSGLTAEGTIIGTPAYMSPEQATGSETDYRSDIYALGIILFELLTGRPPFDDESTVSILLKHAQTPPPNVSQYTEKVNQALDKVLQTVLAKNPDDRYQSARALRLALEEAVNTESHDERYMPSPIVYTPPEKQPATIIIEDELSNSQPKKKRNQSTITRTINTLVLKPAKQNPLGFATLAVAIVALLLIARLLQNQPSTTIPQTDVTTNETVFGVEGMAGVDAMIGDAAFFTGDFDDDDPINEYWDVTSVGPIQRSITDGVYRISHSEPDRAIPSLFDPTHFNYTDVNITLDARILETSANDASAVGIVFRYQDADNYNVFAVDGRGRYSIWRRVDGAWCELRNQCNDGEAEFDWQPEPPIATIGEMNTLNLNVYQNQITGFVNGEQVFMLTENTFADGAIGIYMATTPSGSAQVEIDNYNVSEAMLPASESMTDDS
ncbi:MAG: protein kinase, partial [Chloroflexota bacterium]